MTDNAMTQPWELGSDLPVEDPADDSYGYAPFASRLATAIVDNKSPKGLVIAVHGKWGSGKSSLLNFIKHDLKKLSEERRPVIVDLGLARHVDDESYTALPTPGTPGWMSPEQVGSSPVHGDWRSDQFVIGALAYRLLTNVQPFYALSLIDRWRAPAVQTPQPIRAIDPEIPSAVADVVERMLHKQPHRRYLKVSELLTDLTLAISSMQSASTIETSPQRFLLNIGQVKNYAENGFLSALRPHGVVIDIRAGSRVREFVDAAHDVGAEAIVDPVTHYVRSPLAVRPAGFRKLPYGSAPVLTGFSDETSRREFCTNVLDSVTADEPDAIVSPYFYAA